MVEKYCADIVQMTGKREEALALLIVPDLDLVIVASAHKQRLGLVEGNSTNRS